MPKWKLLQKDVKHAGIATDMQELVECYNIAKKTKVIYLLIE